MRSSGRRPDAEKPPLTDGGIGSTAGSRLPPATAGSGAVLRAFDAFHSFADVHGAVLAAVRNVDFYCSPPGIDCCQGRLRLEIGIAAASTMQALP
jgi:hypothetical protein